MSADWSAGVHRAFRDAAVHQVAVVPNAGLAHLITLCESDPAMRVVRLTSEEEGVALLAGAWLGGEKGVLLMQSSGTGNCLNMLALSLASRFPLLMLVSMRGEPGEANPAQVPLGSAVGKVFEAIGIRVSRVESGEAVPDAVTAALVRVFVNESQEAVLIAQRVLGFKAFK